METTDGIGLEFCKQLARDGFNICLVSRTESKLKAVVENDLKDLGVETRIVIGNFSSGEPASMALYDSIYEQVKDLDIGLVVLNAGVCNHGYFLNVETQKLQEMLDTNCYQVSSMIQKLTPLLAKRSRSAIITMASIASQFSFATNFVYCATKVFAKYMSVGAL